MGEDDAGFRGYYRIEASFVPLAAERLFGGFLGVADIAPLGARPMFDHIRRRRLHAASVVVDGEFNSAEFDVAAEVDLQPIGLGLRFVTGPAIPATRKIANTIRMMLMLVLC